jgi:hypothetical protein
MGVCKEENNLKHDRSMLKKNAIEPSMMKPKYISKLQVMVVAAGYCGLQSKNNVGVVGIPCTNNNVL